MPRRNGLMSQRLKRDLARELGFLHKIKDDDWGNITTREAGNMVKAAVARGEKILIDQMELPHH